MFSIRFFSFTFYQTVSHSAVKSIEALIFNTELNFQRPEACSVPGDAQAVGDLDALQGQRGLGGGLRGRRGRVTRLCP